MICLVARNWTAVQEWRQVGVVEVVEVVDVGNNARVATAVLVHHGKRWTENVCCCG